MNCIKVDNRETELFVLLRDKLTTIVNNDTNPNPISIISSVLDIGDISFSVNGVEIALIERKTLKDLAASIKDGRYEEQSYRLGGYPIHNHNISYLIEGDLTKWSDKTNRIPKSTLYSALTSIQYIKGFSVIRTLCLEDTALYIIHSFMKLRKTVDLGKQLFYEYSSNLSTNITTGQEQVQVQEEEHNYCSVIKAKKKDNITPENMGEIILSQIPGISFVTADAIMSKYKTLPSLTEALKSDSRILLDITYVNNKGQNRKINKSSADTIIKFLSL